LVLTQSFRTFVQLIFLSENQPRVYTHKSYTKPLANISEYVRQIIILILIVGILFGCSKYDYDNSELNNSEFQPYVDSFLEEAKIRGYDIDVSNINFYLADIENKDVGGICNERKEEIIIDRDNWENAHEIEKELLIFHELGHCILGRAHRNETSENGDCLSIMDGTEDNFNCSKNIFSELWRVYYLEELFNVNTVLPNWYTDNQEYVTNYENKLDVVSIEDLNTNFYEISFDFNGKEKFVIEVNYKNWAVVAGTNDDSFVSTVINFGGFFFATYPLSDEKDIRIEESSVGIFHRQENYSFQSDIKLTIRKDNNLIQYFIDEQFIHSMEAKPFKNNLIEALFDAPINMDIKIFEYE
tara:strand:+ start:87261 stop:88328 length:1068 start_codon:yes stop_codon:yes gene_type:complete